MLPTTWLGGGPRGSRPTWQQAHVAAGPRGSSPTWQQAHVVAGPRDSRGLWRTIAQRRRGS